MSVLVTVRFTADPRTAEKVAEGNPDRMGAIIDDARSRGLIHHRFYAREGELLAVDEWQTAEGFRDFFDHNETIPQVMRDIGVTDRPRVEVWREVDLKDAV